MLGRLRAINVENYRCFRDPFQLELRPLTLVYGWNNAGKSTAVRLVRLLGDSIKDSARAPLDPLGDTTYRDLVWKPAVTKPGPLRFGLEWSDDGPTRATWRLDYDRDVGRMYVRELDLLTAGGTEIKLRADRGERDSYEVLRGDGTEPESAKLRFSGLLPDGLALTAPLTDKLRALRGNCRWLSGDRITPPRSIKEGKPPPRELAEDGAGASEMLLSYPALLAAVKPWYAKLGRTLTSSIQEATARLQLNPLDAGFEIDLVDTGSGMGQVLPVLTALAIAQTSVRAGQDVTLAIEEPESQLHPNAQRALGTWLCEIAAQEPAPHLVLETHSRVLILAVQVAIASERLPASSVVVYWLDQRPDGSTSVEKVEFDRFGRPGSGWPRDIFADELELADILSAQQFSNHAWGD